MLTSFTVEIALKTNISTSALSAILKETVDDMMRRRGAIIVLEEQVQIADLVQHDRVVDNASPINLIQLLYRVLLLQVEAEDGIEFLGVTSQTTNQQNLSG